jgi:hypothetical protein
MEPEGSLLHSQEPANGSEACVWFVTCLSSYGEELLAPRPTPKLEDHLLSAVRDCLFSILAATLHIWRPLHYPQPEDPVPLESHGDEDRTFWRVQSPNLLC